MRRSPHTLVLCALAAVLMLASTAAPASARDQGNIGTISPDNRRIQADFTPMVGNYPGRAANAFAYFRPPTCRSVTYCDAFELDVTYPDGLIKEEFFGIRIILTWENPRTEDNANGNDLDLFLWPDDGPVSGGPASKCGSPEAEECENLEKEVITIREPSNTEPDDPDVPPMFFTVVNHAGLNTGYTITVEWFTYSLDFEEFEEFEAPDRRVTESTSGSTVNTGGAPDGTPSGAGTVQGPDEEPRKVLVPGPDGELIEMDVPVLAAGENLEPRDQGGLLSPWAWAVIAAILLGTGAAFVVLHRRREAAEGDLY